MTTVTMHNLAVHSKAELSRVAPGPATTQRLVLLSVTSSMAGMDAVYLRVNMPMSVILVTSHPMER